MVRVDLHTHSIASADGGIRPEQYRRILTRELLDAVAITDHDRVDLAEELQHELGSRIIIGEEISTQGGDIIGLFLQDAIPAGLTPLEASQAIKAQGGLVYIPHPFETVRHGLSIKDLEIIDPLVDIVEVQNGRALFQNRGKEALEWASMHNKLRAASSDAHGLTGLGSTYTVFGEIPNPETALQLLSTATLAYLRPPLLSLLSPKLNRLRKKLGSIK